MKEITLNKDDNFLQRNQNRIYSRGKACVYCETNEHTKKHMPIKTVDLSFG